MSAPAPTLRRYIHRSHPGRPTYTAHGPKKRTADMTGKHLAWCVHRNKDYIVPNNLRAAPGPGRVDGKAATQWPISVFLSQKTDQYELLIFGDFVMYS